MSASDAAATNTASTTSTTSSSSSLDDDSAASFTESRWNDQKAKSSITGTPFIGIYGNSTDDNSSNNNNNHLLQTKRPFKRNHIPYDQQQQQQHEEDLAQKKSLSEEELTVLLDCINQNFLFGHLETQHKDYIMRNLIKMIIHKNEVLYFEGDPAAHCCIVYSGMIGLEVYGKPINQENTSEEDNIDDGESSRINQIYGQLALWTGTPYTETAKALSNTAIVFFLSRQHFQRVMSMKDAATAKAITNNQKIQLLQKSVPSELLEYLEDDPTAFHKLLTGMTTTSFWKGDILHPARDTLTIVIEGKLVASLEGRGNYEELYIGPGEVQTSFGWRMFASQARVSNTLRAETDGQTMAITKLAFTNAFGDHGGASVLKHLATRRLARIQLQQIEVFQDSELDMKQINGLLDVMHHCEYSHYEDEIIMKAGEKVPAAMYFVREGTVVLERFHGKERQLIEQGDYFGEKNMLLDQNNSGQKSVDIRAVATVIAKKPNTKVDILYLEEARNVVDTTLLGLGKPAPVSAMDSSIQWSDLQLHKVLGSGGFGQVLLASIPAHKQQKADPTEASTRQMVALKIQSKHQLLEKSRAEEAMAERNIMASLNSPFIMQLYNSFQDDNHLYMITSVMQGGQLDSLIPQQRGLSESVAKFYAAGILEGLTHMHRHHIIHRDVKPPNVLIDDKGYPVLIDLGFAKYVPDKTYTWCGTPLLMSPEMIRMQGHNKSTDHWSWAILVFKLVTGRYPFQGINEAMLFESICRASFAVVGSFEFRSLMVAILYPDPAKRLGSAVNGWRDIFAHPWFHNDDTFNLQLLRKREMVAPWVPPPSSNNQALEPSIERLDRIIKPDAFPTIDNQEQQMFKPFGPYIDATSG